RMAGFRCCHSAPSFVTVMKSYPKKTPITPGMSNRRPASGEAARADSASRKSAVPSSSTTRPGRNLSVAGLGVASVWMNIDGSPCCLFWNGSKISRKEWLFKPHIGSSRPSSQAFDLLVGQAVRDDGDRNRECGALPSNRRNERPRPFLGVAGAKHQNRDVLVFLDEPVNLLNLLPLPHDEFGFYPDRLAHFGGQRIERGVSALQGLLAHDLLHAQPVLEVSGLDDIEQNHSAVGGLGAPRRIGDGTLAFRRFIDNGEEFPLVAGFPAQTFRDHVRPFLHGRHLAAPANLPLARPGGKPRVSM